MSPLNPNLDSFCRPARILVVGTSCTGKTTLAGQIGVSLALPHIDLDDLHWLPGWKMRSKEEMRMLIGQKILRQPEWVVSGNYTTAGRDTVWQDANTVIWLDYGLPLILSRYIKRTARRLRTKEPCCNGNVETWRSAVFTREILLRYILRSHFHRRPLYKRWMRDEFSDKQWIVLKKPGEANALLKACRVSQIWTG